MVSKERVSPMWKVRVLAGQSRGGERERSHFVVRLVAAIEADYNLMMAAKSVARSAEV